MEQNLNKSDGQESIQIPDIEKFVEVGVLCGQRYLAAGGPTSRLENSLVQAGTTFKITVQVFAMPTGITISVTYLDKTITKMARIQSDFTDMYELKRMEKILALLRKGKLGLDSAHSMLLLKPRQVYPTWLLQTAVFFIGFIACLSQTTSVFASVVAGIITVVTFLLTNGLVSRLRMHGLYSDFFAAFLAMVLAKLASYFVVAPAKFLSLGCFLILLPSLPMVTAIADLTEQNVVSGTARIMKSLLILFALGTAYLLFTDIEQLGWFAWIPQHQQVSVKLSPLWQALGTSFLVGFICIKYVVPRQVIAWAVFTSLTGWIVLYSVNQENLLVFNTFFTSLAVGLVSLLLSRWLKYPSQTFSVPGIFALLPGLLALTSVQSYEATGESIEIMWKVATIASAIVFGLFTARIPFGIRKKDVGAITEIGY